MNNPHSPELVQLSISTIINLGFRGIIIFFSAWWFARRIFSHAEVYYVWCWTFFSAFSAAYFMFLTGITLRLTTWYPSMWVLYFAYLFLFYRLSRPLAKGAPQSAQPRGLTAHIVPAGLVIVFAWYFGAYSRGVPSSGGFFFFFLDLLKFSSAEGLYYPPQPVDITFTSYALTVNSPIFALILLMGVHLGFGGGVWAIAALHGIFTAALLFGLLAVSRELWGRALYGVFAFTLFFLGGASSVTGPTYTAMYMSTPTKEIGVYFLIAFCTLTFLNVVRLRSVESFALMALVMGATFSARPYVLPFAAVCILTAGALVAPRFREDREAVVRSFPLLLAGVVLYSAWYVAAYAIHGHFIPISQVHKAYDLTSPYSLDAPLRLLAHHYFSFVEYFVLGIPAKEAFGFNEVSLWPSLLAFTGISGAILINGRTLMRRHRKETVIFAAAAMVWYALTFALLVEKNRMIYFLTPAISLFAALGLRYLIHPKIALLILAPAVGFALSPWAPSSVQALLVSLRAQTKINVPMPAADRAFAGSVNYMRLMQDTLAANSGAKVLVTGLEPGLDDFALAPGYYFWTAASLAGETERVFQAFGWDPEKCARYLRSRGVTIISFAQIEGGAIRFLADPSSSARFWALVRDNPGLFTLVGKPEGYYSYRSVYRVLDNAATGDGAPKDG